MINQFGRFPAANRFWRWYRTFLKKFIHDHRSFLFLGLWVGTFILGYIGYVLAFSSMGEVKSSVDIFYMTMQLFPMSYKLAISPPNIVLQVARFLAPALFLSTLLLMLISLFWENFTSFLLRMTRHQVIICGLGLLGPVIVGRFCENGYPVVVIEKNPTPEEIEFCNTAGATILKGDPGSPYLLKKAGVDKADILIAVTSDDELNAEIAGRAQAIPRCNTNIPLTCYLHIVDLNLYTLLKQTEFQNTHVSPVRLDLFNIYQTAGTAILNHPKPFMIQNADPSTIRLLVIGLGRTGESLIFQAVKQWRLHNKNSGRKLSITVIDKDAEKKTGLFNLKYRSIARYCDLEPLAMDISTPEFLQTEFLTPKAGHIPYSRIYICLQNHSLGLAAGLTLHNRLQEESPGNQNQTVPIIIRTNHETGLCKYFESLKVQGNVYLNLHAFPLIPENGNLDILLNTSHEAIARALHNTYIEGERKNGHTIHENPLMGPWEDLPEDYKNSNRAQADHIVEKLTKIHCIVAPVIDWDEPLYDISPHVEMLAEMEHSRWMNEKIAAGWHYGPERDDRWWHRRHPSLIPYSDLSESEKEKDRQVIKCIPELLKSVDLKIKQ